MSIEVVREAYDIAWDYLDRIGAIGDPEKAHVRLLASLLDMYNAGIKEQACHGQQGDYGIQREGCGLMAALTNAGPVPREEGRQRPGLQTGSSQIRKQFDTVVSPKSKLTKPIKKPKAIWVEPSFTAQVGYRDITSGGLLRQSSFKGLMKR
jgi:hypothetical protein